MIRVQITSNLNVGFDDRKEMEYAGAAGGSGDVASDSAESYASMHGQPWEISPEPSDPYQEAMEAQAAKTDAQNSIPIELGGDFVIPTPLKEKIAEADKHLMESNNCIETQYGMKRGEEAEIRQIKDAAVRALRDKNRALNAEIKRNEAKIEACNDKCQKDLANCQKKWGASQELEKACRGNVEICHDIIDRIWDFINTEKKNISPETPHSLGSTDDEGGAGMDTRVLKGVCPKCSKRVYDNHTRGKIDGNYYHHECMLRLGMTPALDEYGCHRREVKRPKGEK